MVACLIAQALRQAFWVLRVFAMRVVLTRKLANCLDGVDVSDRQVGDVLDLPAADARSLLAEQWAIPDRREHIRAVSPVQRRATDADPSPVPSAERASGSGAPHAGRRTARVEPA
jgi:hypothetical protein